MQDTTITKITILQIEHYSLQLVHQEIDFRACAFLKIDYSLIVKVILLDGSAYNLGCAEFLFFTFVYPVLDN